MKLDPKYFPPFLIILAVAAALLITYFTVSSQQGQRDTFREYAMEQDSLQSAQMPEWEGSDSLNVVSFPGQYVIVDFWATWSNYSEEIHDELNRLKEDHPNKLTVIAAVVRDRPQDVNDYIERRDDPFLYTDGTKIFNQYSLPGLPVQIVYKPSGELMDVFYGLSDSAKVDSLNTLLSDE